MEEDAIKSDGYESYCSTSQDMRKRSKLSEEDRLARCRERNKIHARNTRERKKVQLGALQLRFQKLMDEKLQLEKNNVDSVAHILISLGGEDNEFAETKHSKDDTISSHARMQADMAIEKIRASISALLSDDEDIGESSESLIQRQKNYSSTSDLVVIRRERNKLHAKRTRMRKKKMFAEMESLIAGLEKEIATLKKYKAGAASSSSDQSCSKAEKNDKESSEQSGNIDMVMTEDFPSDNKLDTKSLSAPSATSASTGAPIMQSSTALTLNDSIELKSTFARYQKFPKLMLPISSLMPISSSSSPSPYSSSIGSSSSSIKVHASACAKSLYSRSSHPRPVMRDTETQTMDIRDYPDSLITASRLDPPQLTRRSSIGSETDFFVPFPCAASVSVDIELPDRLFSSSGSYPASCAEQETENLPTSASYTKKQQQDKNDDDAIDSLILLSSR